jgi:DNA helicase II / ATP-dependent DNA helicase PcrA
MNEAIVAGPPGTGKTRYLVRQIENMLETQRYGENIMVTSFTKTAAFELAKRASKLPRSNIGTLHSFGYRTLGRPTLAEKDPDFVSAWNAEYPQYAIGVVKNAPTDEGYEDMKAGAGAVGRLHFMEYQRLRALMRPVESWPAGIQTFAKAWEGAKREADVIDYTDMIAIPLADVERAPGNPQVMFVDETQDMTRLELSLARKWAQPMEILVLAGDDDQCIYSFKGASHDAFIDPNVPDQMRQVLSQSYRVPRAVHALSQSLVLGLSSRLDKQYAPRDADGSIRHIAATWQNPDEIVKEIEYLLEFPKERVMILAACSYMLNPLLAALRSASIPFYNYYRPNRGDWNPLSTRGVSAGARLLSYLVTRGYEGGGETRMWTRRDLQAWVPAIEANGNLKRGAKKVIEAFEFDDEVEEPELEQWQLQEYFPDEVLFGPNFGTLDWFSDALLLKRRSSYKFPLDIVRAHGVPKLKERPQVCVGTIHSVKGGEAEHVYLFPDLSAAGAREYTHSAETRDRAIRQFYVGVTRARDSLTICQPQSATAMRFET